MAVECIRSFGSHLRNSYWKVIEARADHIQGAVGSGATPPTVRMPWVGRGLAPTILATLAVVFALDWAQRFVIGLAAVPDMAVGVWRMLPSGPITVIVKVVDQHGEQRRPVAELPGG